MLGQIAHLKVKLYQIATLTFIIASAAPAHAGWKQTFSEDFNQTQLDTGKWQTRDYWGLQNSLYEKDRQCYVDKAVGVANGKLSLTATNEVPVNCVPDLGNLQFTSGLISTAQSFNQAFGYFEVRAKGVKGAGLAAQFRLGIPGGSFPPLPPEFLPMEILGKDTNKVVQRYAYLDQNGNILEDANVTSAAGIDYAADFHTYGMDWSPGLVIYYVDGVETYRYKKADLYSEPVYLILDLSVGSTRAGDGDVNMAPAALDVDFVRVYARVNDGTDDALPPGVKPPVVADTIAPSVKVSAPVRVAFGSTVSFSATASDAVGVTEVSFAIDGKQVCVVKAAPYVCKVKIDEKNVSKRTLTITAQAKDAAGNVGTSSAQSEVQVSLIQILLSLFKAFLKAIFG